MNFESCFKVYTNSVWKDVEVLALLQTPLCGPSLSQAKIRSIWILFLGSGGFFCLLGLNNSIIYCMNLSLFTSSPTKALKNHLSKSKHVSTFMCVFWVPRNGPQHWTKLGGCLGVCSILRLVIPRQKILGDLRLCDQPGSVKHRICWMQFIVQ